MKFLRLSRSIVRGKEILDPSVLYVGFTVFSNTYNDDVITAQQFRQVYFAVWCVWYACTRKN